MFKGIWHWVISTITKTYDSKHHTEKRQMQNTSTKDFSKMLKPLKAPTCIYSKHSKDIWCCAMMYWGGLQLFPITGGSLNCTGRHGRLRVLFWNCHKPICGPRNSSLLSGTIRKRENVGNTHPPKKTHFKNEPQTLRTTQPNIHWTRVQTSKHAHTHQNKQTSNNMPTISMYCRKDQYLTKTSQEIYQEHLKELWNLPRHNIMPRWNFCLFFSRQGRIWISAEAYYYVEA